MMELYRKHRINPLGGCLPILLQMPIYFALYSMLGNAVELYRVRLGWIADMTAADPYYVLPLLTGVLMFLQTKLSAKTTPVDPQMKPVMTMMPIMFTVFSIFLPAGLTLYILTNTVLGIVQQEVINYVNRSNKQPKKGGQGKKGGKTHKEHHANEDQNAVPANDATVEVLDRAQDASSDDGADTGAAKASAGPKPSDPHKPKAKAKKRK
jgi:YidC/Oxa1 family membrane protein insertase